MCVQLVCRPARRLACAPLPLALAELHTPLNDRMLLCRSTVMVPDPQLDRALVESVQADQVLSSLADFDPQSWGLPPFAA